MKYTWDSVSVKSFPPFSEAPVGFPATPTMSAAIQSEQICLRIPSQPAWIEPTVAFLRRRLLEGGAFAEARADQISLALREAVSNALIHGNLEIVPEDAPRETDAVAELLLTRAAEPHYGGRVVEITFSHRQDRCVWTITDQGKGFPVARELEKQPPPGVGHVGCGRGLFVLRALLDEVHFELGGRQVILTVLKKPHLEPRRSLRIAFKNPIEVFPLREDGTIAYDKSYEAACHELTETGIAFLQRASHLPERMVIGVESRTRMLFLPAILASHSRIDSKLSEVRCRFLTKFDPEGPAPPLDDALGKGEWVSEPAETLQAMQHAQATGDERRVHPRVVYRERVEMLGAPEGGALFACDLSKGGIALISTFKVNVNETRALHLRQPPKTALQILMRVVRCEKIMEGLYEVAGEFLTSGIPTV
jgi:anti-sigma regulatory factor (Ser/Thr protein kinase)